MSTFSIACRRTGQVAVLDVTGRIGLGEGARALRAALCEMNVEGQARIFVDLAMVSHLDSSGLGALIVGYNTLKERGATIGLLRVPRPIQELLALSRLTDVFQVFESEAEALASAS